METTIDRFGRVLIPKSVRADLGLSPGTQLEIEERDGGIFLRSEKGEEALRLRKGVLVFGGEATGDLDSAVRRARDDRSKSVRPRRK